MSQVIVLDTGPLGLVTNPKLSAESAACAQWLQAHVTLGSRVLIPEIADYEVRRELLRASKTKGVARQVFRTVKANHPVTIKAIAPLVYSLLQLLLRY